MTKLNLNYYKGKDFYSDGDVENDILEIVKKYTDFTDILQQDNRWPIMYHLTPVRGNLVEWYDFDKDANLLEIGGGCGAFSGIFANKLRDVKVVELSRRRSEIIYERHKNYDNLEIIVGNLNDIAFEEKFDYVTLIGVLEYAGKFTDGLNPYENFLKKISSYLKPNGKLILAIENKFGLKYWAGATEDHTNRNFDSIEGYPNDKTIQTFGKQELTNLLTQTGFKNLDYYYPMPDYKLPKVIYSDNYLPDESAAFDKYSPNYDNERNIFFDESLAYHQIIKNNMFDFFANSFLVVASL